MDLNNDIGLGIFHSDGEVSAEEDDERRPSAPLNEDSEQESHQVEPAGDATQVIKPKRVIKNPQPKLDARRLMGPRGIVSLQSSFKNTKFKGKGHEKEDLDMLMKKLEHWAHRLFPKLKFDDTLMQIEKLGTKKPVQNMVKRIRLDMFQSDEVTDQQENKDVDEEMAVEKVDVFDELVGTVSPVDTNVSNATNITNATTVPAAVANIQPNKVTSLTEEQRERMERNRLLALERRKARMQEPASNTNKDELLISGITNEETVGLIQNADKPPTEDSVKRLGNQMDTVLPSRTEINDSSNEMDCEDGSVLGVESNMAAEMDKTHEVSEVNVSNVEPTSPPNLEVSVIRNTLNTSGKELEKSNESEIFTENDVLSFVNEKSN